jgi:hypothetical protein
MTYNYSSPPTLDFESPHREGLDTDVGTPANAKEAGAGEQHFRLITDSVPGLVLTATVAGEFEFLNRQLLEYFGRSLEELQAWQADGTVHPYDLDRVIDEWRRGIASRRPYATEHRLRRADGVYRWFQVRMVPGHDARGRLIRWYGLLSDIDDLKCAEEALRSSERSLRLLIDGIPGLVYSMTPTCGLELVNSQVLEYFGRTFEEMKAWDRTGCVHPDDMPRVLDSRQRTVEFGEPHEVEHRLRRADGVYRWFKPRSLALRDADGRIIRWYCLLTDIDDLKRAEEVLRSTQARLSRAAHLATVSELSASIAHEVNQPLAAVVANGHACRQWLAADPPNVERALLSAERVIRDGNSAAEIISRIRSLFRRAPPVKDLLDMNEVIEEVCSLIADDLRTRGVVLRIDLQADLPQTAADRVQMQEVVANLARNGIEAMDAVRERPKQLLISSRSCDGEVAVHVRDHGVGLSEPDTLFEPLYTTKTSGMGMGLAICRSIIEAHGGRLWATHNVPHGATFGFALRIAGSELQ